MQEYTKINDRGSILDRTLQRKREAIQSKQALRRTILNFILTVIFIVDLGHDIMPNFAQYFSFSVNKNIHITVPTYWFWYGELSLIAIFALNTIVNLLLYVRMTWLYIPVIVTNRQKMLLSINDREVGFLPPKMPTNLNKLDTTTVPHFLNNSFLHSSSLNTSGDNTWSLSRSSLNQSVSSPSWSYYPNNVAYQRSPARSPNSFSRAHLRSPNQSDSFDDSSFRRNQFTSTPTKESIIEDEASLVKYLKQFEQANQSDDFSSHSPPNVTSFWNIGHTLLDYSSLLRKYSYQLASRTVQPFTSHPDGDSSLSTHSSDIDVWLRYGVVFQDVYSKNLRQWLASTIFERVVQEIDAINDTLSRMGSADLRVGEVSVSTLRQVFRTKSQFIPTLTVLLPYLEMTPNQEYLVQRVRELSRGGCMSDFVWNGGGQFKGKTWGDHLPTDSTIVMHFFCTYLDSRLPPHPNHPDGKIFTSQRFVRTPDKPVLIKDTLCIYQTTITPPHFKLVVGEEILDLTKGRNNLFHVLLLFLLHIKTKENGMLGRVNLGLSGINILWVLENN